MNKVIFILSFLILSSVIIAQTGVDTYKPFQNSPVLVENAEQHLNQTYKSSLKSTKDKELIAFYTKRYNTISSKFNNSEFLFDSYFQAKLKGILDEIIINNNIDRESINTIVVGRSYTPNAYCYGNGLMVMNLGLIARLENDDQLAFVISHELAHQLLNHVDKRVLMEIERRNSKDYKDELESIKKRGYDVLEGYEKLSLNKSLESSAHTRKGEIEADSLAIILLKNTSYNLNEAISTLDILDQIDLEKYKDSINFNQVFDYKDFKFKEKWLVQRNGLNVLQKMDQELIDSLKTHPDCKDRIALLQGNFGLDSLAPHSVNSKFLETTILADFELIQFQLEQKSYSESLKNSLLLLNKYPKNTYLLGVIGISLSEIYFATKNHTLNKYVPRPSDNYPFNLQRTLLLIENIRIYELKELTLTFYEKHLSNFSSDELLQSEQLMYANYLRYKIEEQAGIEKIKKSYNQLYPNGNFSSLINN